jgi:16S rRNA (guanine(966)-N(2))-methyltransferase RsmD
MKAVPATYRSGGQLFVSLYLLGFEYNEGGNSLRVIAGEYRGRKLDSIEGMDIRPTSDRVKESLFNILGASVIDRVFLDLFGGTGGIGIEALSRGAKHVVFVDNSIKSIKVLRGNLDYLNIKDNVEVLQKEYSAAISQFYKYNKQFDIIFIDPPYSIGIAQNALELIDKYPIISLSGFIIVEHDLKDTMPQEVGKLYQHRIKKYGNTVLSFYSY